MIDFVNYLSPGRKGHLVGIGGVSMSSLAEVLQGRGIVVTGSDINESPNVRTLREHGIPVAVGHRAENVAPDVEFLVRTAAVHNDNPEVIYARAHNIPVYERSEAWGALSRDYSNALCIAGTHGKTTTTSMCTHILMAADRDPTVMIGGTLPLLNAGHRVGHGNTIVMESCEYYNSFLSFYPTVAVILNIEADHLDFFRDLADVEDSFRAFAERVPGYGNVVANYDDQNTMDTLKGLDRKIVTFGLSPEADVHAENVRYHGARSKFDIYYKNNFFTDVTLNVPGEHNVKNALAATAAAICLGVRPLSVKYGLAGFSAAGRRFEFKGKFNGADVYDDYAHHPGELKALLDTVEKLNYQRTVLVFQPHTYSRTRSLFDDFVKQLRRPDVLLLAEIYAAREQNTIGISSADLAAQIEGSRFFPSFEELEAALRETAQPGDIILTVGAGNVFRVGEDLVGQAEGKPAESKR
jgi:UDP-N-acetylmuramate--alanine ligase